MDELLEPTPQHELKPHLEWCGRLLGRDLYIDTRDPAMRDLAQKILSKKLNHNVAIEPELNNG